MEEKRNGQRFLTARDMEEEIQATIAKGDFRGSYSRMDFYTLLAQIKQVRATEHIANLIRDGKLKIVTE